MYLTKMKKCGSYQSPDAIQPSDSVVELEMDEFQQKPVLPCWTAEIYCELTFTNLAWSRLYYKKLKKIFVRIGYV